MEYVPLRKFIDMLPIFIPFLRFVENLEGQGEQPLAEAMKDAVQFATADRTIMLRFNMEDGVLKDQLKAMARKQGFELP
jgi:hypothetical protein